VVGDELVVVLVLVETVHAADGPPERDNRKTKRCNATQKISDMPSNATKTEIPPKLVKNTLRQ
jgi:hypothetical protein